MSDSSIDSGQRLPSGTVTFLFTDIESSAELAQQYPDALPALLARHHTIMREAIESNHGQVFRISGDAFCAAFATPSNALKAALMAQQTLQHEEWMPAPIQVRMGIHTGEAQTDLTEKQSFPYSGYLTLTRVQRVMSTAYCGQILLSDETAELVRRQMPEGVTLRDMGVHRLKGLANLERLWQVCAPALRSDFPPLPTLSTIPNNLPIQLTSFVGREQELAEEKQLLRSTHLLTLTGPGGTGKTRLSLQLAAEVLETFTNGVWLVELAPLADPTLLAQTIAATLGVREQPQRSIRDALMDYLRAKNLLLILDNCEHLIDACAQLANTLLRAAPGLKILATSREALGIAGETAYRVPSLPLPDAHMERLDALTQNDCVHLFVDRAVAASPHFHFTERDASAIVDTCRRLDGIPLAIELAAARIKIFPPEQIAARLDDRFRLLTGGSRAALERHQTLRALIDWSYDLLPEAECLLLQRLSVFAGGWTFEAAQDVCGDGMADEALDFLTHLVDKSLVAVEERAEGRYRLLETIRQYARDKLFEAGEGATVRDRHLEYFLRLAETAEPKLRSSEQIEWLERIETEYDNLRTALAWSLEGGKSDRALRLTGTLYYFWALRGYFTEMSKWLNDALTCSEREQSEKVAAGKYTPTRAEMAQRAKALYGATLSHFADMDVKKGRMQVEESLRLWRELGDTWWTAVALELKALMLSLGPDFEMALACLQEGIALGRQIEDPWPLAVCLIRMGDALKPAGKAAEARLFLEEGVALARRIGDKAELSEGLRELGSLYYIERDFTAAMSLTEEALANARAIRSVFGVFLALAQLVIISCLQSDPAKARGYSLELWALGKDTGSPFAALFAILAFGLAASVGGDLGRGVRLLAATQVLFAEAGFNPGEGDTTTKVVRQVLDKTRAHLGPEAFEAAMVQGRALTMEQAIALATENDRR